MYEEKIDETRFDAALRAARTRERAGIGTLDEKLLHAAIKNYFAPPEKQEVKVGRSVVDVLDGEEIVEIQTGSCHPLKKKLPALLENMRLTVVCPVMVRRTLFWIDPESGDLSPGRKSPKKGRTCDILPELLYLDGFFDTGRFKLALFLYDGEEYRLRNGWGSGGKRGATRTERLPRAPLSLVYIESPEDYVYLLPDLCPERFTQSDFSRLTRYRGVKLWSALKVLCARGLLEKEKIGNKVFYTLKKQKRSIQNP